MKINLLKIIIVFLLITCFSCSKDNDLVFKSASKMFKSYKSIKKIKEIDYIVFSFHYEVYEVVIYRVIDGEINSNFYFNTLSELDDSITNKVWQCNNKDSIIDYFPIFSTKIKYRKKVMTDIYKGFLDSKSWCYLIIMENMNWLFLFTPTDNLLYYVRWNV